MKLEKANTADNSRKIINIIDIINFKNLPPINSDISIISWFEKFLKMFDIIVQNIMVIILRKSKFAIVPVPVLSIRYSGKSNIICAIEIVAIIEIASKNVNLLFIFPPLHRYCRLF